VTAIEEGWMQGQIEDSAYREARRQSTGESIVVGVNKFTDDGKSEVAVHEVDPRLEAEQRDRLERWRSERNQAVVERALKRVETGARTDENLLHPMKEALIAGATVGEVSAALLEVFGRHRPGG
jgi:methylmalonyl-CoA mutase N-terminal domain/subunit